MSLWGVIRRNLSLRDARFWSGWAGGDTWSGEPVTVDRALQLSAFWACARLISETVATLPVMVLEKRGADRVARPDHPLYALLHDSPNADQTACEYLEGQFLGLCTWGNAYSEKVFSGDRLAALQPLQVDLVTPYRDREGDLRYRFTDRGKAYDLPDDKIFHLRGFGAGGDVGLSPVAYARQTLGVTIATERATGSTFAGGMKASGFFTFPANVSLTEPQFEQARRNLVEPYQGAGATGKAGILDSGVTFNPVNIPPRDAEMLLSRKFNVEEVCRWLGVPPVLIGHAAEGVTAWGTGIETLMLAWLTTGLRRYLVRFEQAARKRLLSPTERGAISVEFNVEGLLRGDSASRASFISTMVQNGIYSRNRARAIENEPRDPDPMSDALTVQSNLVPLAKLGTTPAARVQPAPGEPIPEPAT